MSRFEEIEELEVRLTRLYFERQERVRNEEYELHPDDVVFCELAEAYSTFLNNQQIYRDLVRTYFDNKHYGGYEL